MLAGHTVVACGQLTLIPTAVTAFESTTWLILVTVIDHDEVQVDCARRGSERGGSGAIPIHGVGAVARRPLLWWRRAVNYNVVYLCDVTVAVVMLHHHAAKRSVRKERTLQGEPVIARKRAVRAASVA